MSGMPISKFVEKVSEIMPVVMREFYRQQTSEFFKLKITLPQFVVMELLARRDEYRMSDLAHIINVTTAAMTGIVDRLVRDGYVKRSSDPKDRRIVKVSLTAKGVNIVRRMIDQRKGLMENIFGVISQKERGEYLKILGHIHDHLKNNKG
jgi:DNA-binding MarR family transcriptional regulator